MGNLKVYTLRFPLLPGESLITKEEVQKAVCSSVAMVDEVRIPSFAADAADEVMALVMAESCSMGADYLITVIRERYPRRWCMVTRLDTEMGEFMTAGWDDDGSPLGTTVWEPVREGMPFHG